MVCLLGVFLEGLQGFNPEEGPGNNRSVMPLDILGSTRATIAHSMSNFSLLGRAGYTLNVGCDWDRAL